MDIRKRVARLEQNNKPPEDSTDLIFVVPGGVPEDEIENSKCIFLGGGEVLQEPGESFEDFEARAERIYGEHQHV